MLYNKNQYRKTDDKKLLRKIGKHWAVISTAVLGMIGAGTAASLPTHAASVNPDAQNVQTDRTMNSNNIVQHAQSQGDNYETTQKAEPVQQQTQKANPVQQQQSQQTKHVQHTIANVAQPSANNVQSAQSGNTRQYSAINTQPVQNAKTATRSVQSVKTENNNAGAQPVQSFKTESSSAVSQFAAQDLGAYSTADTGQLGGASIPTLTSGYDGHGGWWFSDGSNGHWDDNPEGDANRGSFNDPTTSYGSNTAPTLTSGSDGYGGYWYSGTNNDYWDDSGSVNDNHSYYWGDHGDGYDDGGGDGNNNIIDNDDGGGYDDGGDDNLAAATAALLNNQDRDAQDALNRMQESGDNATSTEASIAAANAANSAALVSEEESGQDARTIQSMNESAQVQSLHNRIHEESVENSMHNADQQSLSDFLNDTNSERANMNSVEAEANGVLDKLANLNGDEYNNAASAYQQAEGRYLQQLATAQTPAQWNAITNDFEASLNSIISQYQQTNHSNRTSTVNSATGVADTDTNSMGVLINDDYMLSPREKQELESTFANDVSQASLGVSENADNSMTVNSIANSLNSDEEAIKSIMSADATGNSLGAMRAGFPGYGFNAYDFGYNNWTPNASNNGQPYPYNFGAYQDNGFGYDYGNPYGYFNDSLYGFAPAGEAYGYGAVPYFNVNNGNGEAGFNPDDTSFGDWNLDPYAYQSAFGGYVPGEGTPGFNTLGYDFDPYEAGFGYNGSNFAYGINPFGAGFLHYDGNVWQAEANLFSAYNNGAFNGYSNGYANGRDDSEAQDFYQEAFNFGLRDATEGYYAYPGMFNVPAYMAGCQAYDLGFHGGELGYPYGDYLDDYDDYLDDYYDTPLFKKAYRKAYHDGSAFRAVHHFGDTFNQGYAAGRHAGNSASNLSGHSDAYAAGYVQAMNRRLAHHPKYMILNRSALLHSSPLFSDSNAIEGFYGNNRRRCREFVVNGIAVDPEGRVRYHVVGLGKFGWHNAKPLNGWITASHSFVRNAYYQRYNVRNHSDSVMTLRPISIHASARDWHQTPVLGHIRAGKRVWIKDVVRVGGITRFYIGHGAYITSNKNYVQWLD